MDSTEHIEVGNAISLTMPDGSRQPAGTTPLFTVTSVTTSMRLHYGEIVALGGDFYGAPNATSISNPNVDGPGLFSDAYFSLKNINNRTPGASELQGILAVIMKEQAAVQAARNAVPPKQPSTAFDALGDSLSFQWDDTTHGRYLQLAADNMDHFGADARKVYMIGHAKATQAAAFLHGKTSLPPSMPGGPPGSIESALLLAYARNAFADHFLTDLFAAGHLRTPRRGLYNLPGTFPTETGLLAKAMHDEDNLNGLNVSNNRGDEWKAFGDGKELDDENKRNFDLAVEAVQASADEVYEAFNYGIALFPAPAALEIAPKPIYPEDATTPPIAARDPQGKIMNPNYAPMFWASQATPMGKVWRRGYPNDDWRNRDNWSISPQWSVYPMVSALLSAMLDKDAGVLAWSVARTLKLPIAGRQPA